MGMGNLPDSYNLIVNSNHPLITKLAGEIDEEARKQLAKQLIDIALLSQNLLRGEDLTRFIRRSVEIL